MGYSISWLAVHNKPTNLLKTLRLLDTRIPCAPGMSKYVGASLPNGWYVIVADEFEHEWLPDLENISQDCLLVGCTARESANASRAFLYRESMLKWEVAHVLDEGRDHLSVVGNAPPSTSALMSAARQEAQAKGHDAVFSVPLMLAYETCGFRHDQHQALQFTQLEPVPLLPGGQICEALFPRVEGILTARGFVRRDVPQQHSEFIATTSEGFIRCEFACWSLTGALLTFRIFVENRRVQQLLAAVFSDAESRKPSLKTNFFDLVGVPGFVHTAEDLSLWIGYIDNTLPAWIDRLHNVKTLDTLNNDGRQRYNLLNQPTDAHYDEHTGFTPLVVAYLAGNPNFDRMVAQTDPEHGKVRFWQPKSAVQRLVQHLRAHARFGEWRK